MSAVTDTRENEEERSVLAPGFRVLFMIMLHCLWICGDAESSLGCQKAERPQKAGKRYNLQGYVPSNLPSLLSPCLLVSTPHPPQ